MKVKELIADALPIISTFAPTFARVLGGPVGLVFGIALPLVANAFGVKMDNLEALSKTIMNDPDAKNKLQLCELNHADLLGTLIDSINSLSSAEINVKLNWKND